MLDAGTLALLPCIQPMVVPSLKVSVLPNSTACAAAATASVVSAPPHTFRYLCMMCLLPGRGAIVVVGAENGQTNRKFCSHCPAGNGLMARFSAKNAPTVGLASADKLIYTNLIELELSRAI